MSTEEKEVRVRWTDDERERLAKTALPWLLADDKMLIVEAVRRAQDVVLPKERRRNIANIGSVPIELRNLLESRRRAAKGEVGISQEDAKNLQENLQKAYDDVNRLTEENQALKAELNTYYHLPKPPEPLDIIKGFFTDILADALARGSAVPGIRMEPVKAPPTPKHDPVPPASTTVRAPVILVAGLKSPEQALFEEKYKGRIRFKFWRDESYDLLHNRAIGANMTFAMLDAVGHKVSDTLKKAGVEYQMVRGAHTSLESQLDGWLERHNRSTKG